MKKYLAIVAFILLGTTQAHAVAPLAPPAYVAPGAYYGGPKLIPFASAVGFAAFVIYANANGIPFPLCGVAGLTCEYSYPTDKNGMYR